MEEANTRQLVSRARKHIADGRHTPVSSQEQRRLLEAFIGATQKGDLAALEALFAEDVVSYLDGGGIVRTAARAPVSGRERVAKFIASFASHFWTGLTLAWFETNGQASVLMSRDGIPGTFVTIDASAHGIDRIMWIMRPALGLHGAFYIAMRIVGTVNLRSRLLGRQLLLMLTGLTVLGVPATIFVRERTLDNFIHHPLLLAIPLGVALSLAAMWKLDKNGNEHGTFVASCCYLLLMLTGAAASLYPILLPSDSNPEFDITVFHAAPAIMRCAQDCSGGPSVWCSQCAIHPPLQEVSRKDHRTNGSIASAFGDYRVKLGSGCGYARHPKKCEVNMIDFLRAATDDASGNGPLETRDS